MKINQINDLQKKDKGIIIYKKSKKKVNNLRI